MTTEESVVVNCDVQSLDIVGKFCYLGDTIGATGGVEDSVTARIKSGWNRFMSCLLYTSDAADDTLPTIHLV